MNHSEHEFVNHQQVEIFSQRWLPGSTPRAGLLMSHGLAEHSSRYGEMATWLAGQGVACFGLDHPGHGRSSGVRVYVDQFLDFTATLRQYQEQLQQEYPDLPFFLYGHSMGGLIATHFLADYQDDFQAAILSATLARVPSNISGFTVFMGKTLSRLIPKTPLVAIDSQGITSDPEANRIYDEDPLVHRGKTTARLAAELLKAMQGVPEAAHSIHLPVLVLHGESDPLVDPEYAPFLHDLLGSPDKTLKTYPGLFHEIHQEPSREEVFRDILNWIDTHLAG